MNNPKVSILLPTYNGARYIEKALRSILSQTFADWELLVINDASTDATTKIILVNAESDIRIRLISNNSNLGLQKTLNRGLSEARGMYIARIDDDDEWTDPNKLADQVSFLDTHSEYVLVGTLFKVVDEVGNEIKTMSLPLTDEAIRKDILIYNPFGHSTIMARKETMLACGAYSEDARARHMEDYDLWLKMGTRGKLANLEKVTTRYLSKYGMAKKAMAGHILVFRLRSILKYSPHYSNLFTALYRLMKHSFNVYWHHDL